MQTAVPPVIINLGQGELDNLQVPPSKKFVAKDKFVQYGGPKNARPGSPEYPENNLVKEKVRKNSSLKIIKYEIVHFNLRDFY